MRITREQALLERDLARADVRRLTAALADRVARVAECDSEIARLKNEIARLVRERGDLLADDERDRG